jgi:5-methylcytosine-specific restriction endonuclease McrA
VQCTRDYQYKEYITEWKVGNVDGRKGVSQTSNYIRRYLSEKYNETCQSCGIKDWNGKPITMQLEHSDGNSRNNAEDNLLLLCPNCHTQTEFYGSKNKGRGRGSLVKTDA